MEDPAALQRLAQALKDRGYRFVTVSPATHARVNSRPGNEWATAIEGVFGWSRPFLPEVLPPAIFALMRAAGVAVRHDEGWRSLVGCRPCRTSCSFIRPIRPLRMTPCFSVRIPTDLYRHCPAISPSVCARCGAWSISAAAPARARWWRRWSSPTRKSWQRISMTPRFASRTSTQHWPAPRT